MPSWARSKASSTSPPAAGFRLTARADRIDVAEDGAVVIYDYKTGKVPLETHVDKLLRAAASARSAIAEEGGFADLGKRKVSGLVYIGASGRHDGGDGAGGMQPGPGRPCQGSAATSWCNLIERYNDPAMPYEVKRRKGQAFASLYRYDEYEHLAPLKEWLTQEAEDEFR